MNSETDLDKWRVVLNWKKIPNFSNCHEIDNYEEFVNNYCVTENLKTTVDNILLALDDGGKEQLNRCIIGKPGSGKTSFVHFLQKSSLHGDKITSNFFFHIFDINKADIGNNSDYIASEIAKSWTKYFEISGHTDVSRRINAQLKSNREKCTLFADYYSEKKSLFRDKTFIFILDETDTLEEAKVKEIATKIISIITPKEVKKWLMIRAATYKSYATETHGVFESFFPDQTNFNGANLHDIIAYRIERTSGSESPKNPFSKKFCSGTLRRAFGGNTRAALGSLVNILKYSNLGSIEPHAAEEFIQKFVDKSALTALLRLTHIPNIYSKRFRTSQFPLVLDYIRLARFGTDRGKFIRALREVCLARATDVGILGYRDQPNKVLTIPMSEIDATIQECERAGLFERVTRNETVLSEMGFFVAEISQMGSYVDSCLVDLANSNDELTSRAQRIINSNIDHESFMIHDYISGV